MMSYYINWFHLFVIHFGMWVSFMFGAKVMKGEIPEPEQLLKLLKSVVILAVVLSVFSSHSHAHYISHLLAIAK
jgi:hypothetical protein